MIKPELVQAGDILFDVHRTRGNNGGSRLGVWEVRVLEVGEIEQEGGHKTRYFMISWNTNPPRRVYAGYIRKLRRSIPKKLQSRQP